VLLTYSHFGERLLVQSRTTIGSSHDPYLEIGHSAFGHDWTRD
jgi:hypothetical protein